MNLTTESASDYKDVKLYVVGTNRMEESKVLEFNLNQSMIESQEIYIIGTGKDNKTYYNEAFITTYPTSKDGIYHVSDDNMIEGYMTPKAETAYLVISQNNRYSNGKYTSVSPAAMFVSNGNVASAGEILAAANRRADLDYTSLKWFVSKDNGKTWTGLDTEQSISEDRNINVVGSTSGDGVPDWYADEFELWDQEDRDKNLSAEDTGDYNSKIAQKEVEAAKNALQDTLAAAEAEPLDKAEYSDTSWAVYETVLAQAKEVLASEKAVLTKLSSANIDNITL